MPQPYDKHRIHKNFRSEKDNPNGSYLFLLVRVDNAACFRVRKI